MTLRSLILALAIALPAPALHAAEGNSVTLDGATQTRLGIATAPAAASGRSGMVTGFAKVMDPIPLATLDADIVTAAAAAAASSAEAARSQSLFAADATVSAKAAQAAQAQARADTAKLALLRRRLGLEWGPAFLRMSDGARAQLVNALASGQAALVRVDVSGAPPAGLRTVTIDLGAGGMAKATVLGPARTSDPRLQSTGLVAQVSGAAAAQLSSGLVAPVQVATGGGAPGVIVPRSAALRTGGQTVVYVRRSAMAFERRTVSGVISDPAGLFISSGITPGEAVVVQGASALLAAQAQPTTGN